MTRPILLAALGALFVFGCAEGPPPTAKYPGAPALENSADFGNYVWQDRTHAWARTNVGCAQAITFETKTAGYRWGEVVRIIAHADHHVAGQVRMHLGTQESTTFFANYSREISRAGDVGDDTRCRASGQGGVAVLTPVATATATGTTGAPPASAPSIPQGVITIDASLDHDPRPGYEIFRDDLEHGVWEDRSLDLPPVPAGVTLKIELWGMSAIDWTGITFEIVTSEIVPKDAVVYRKWLEDKRWAFKHPPNVGPHIADCENRLAAPDCADVRVSACQTKRSNLELPACADVKRSLDDAGSQGEITNTPPPAPRAEVQPPKPSEHAVWVGGHWVYVHGGWTFWSAGFWRVGEDDQAQGKTATAPSAPPPPKVEPEVRATPPAPGAVWTAGYWHWSAGWTWVAGAWRVPPTPTVVWQPYTWRVDVSGSFKLVVGGWLVR